MTETRQGKSNFIPKPLSQACLAGLTASGLAVAFGTPLEYAPRIFLAGSCFSFYLSFQDGRSETKPKPKRNRGRSIPFSSAKGTKQVYPDDMEYSIEQGRYITRETWGDTLNRLVFGRKEVKPVRVIEPVDRPKILDEFVFVSYYKGQTVQLREKHVKLFLASAWRNRDKGVGLSTRHWDRRRSQRPAWFRELNPLWYFGMSMLLWNADKYLDRQLVITLNNQQSFLAVEPRELFCCLKWYESEKKGQTASVTQNSCA